MTLPLDGIRVLDLTRLLPGPHCTLLFADFGADVIKIEDPYGGDYARNIGPKIGDQSAMFVNLNRNKRSITLNLKSQKDKEIFIDLVKTADVLIESFRPGVMAGLGISYEELKKHNSRLIYCAITGYGQTGPYANQPGHDLNFLSYTGLLHLQGEQNKNPLIPSVQMGDIGGGSLMATIGILLAIIDAKKTGKGQFVDISMLDSTISRMQTILPNYIGGNESDRKDEIINNETGYYDVYETRYKRFLAVGAFESKFWQTFCTVIGKEELMTKLHAPVKQQKMIKAEIQTVIKEKTLKEWVDLFKGNEACVSPVLTPTEMLEDKHIQYRSMIENVQLTNNVWIKQIGNPIKLSRSEVTTRRLAPRLGEQTEEILEELGYDKIL